MKRRMLSVSALALWAACTCALAQTTAAFVGTWRVSWQGDTRPLEAKLTLSETGGTWKTLGVSARGNACMGREVDVVVESATDTDAQLRLKYSELAGCTDLKVTLKKVDDKTLTGFRGKSELSLVRD